MKKHGLWKFWFKNGKLIEETNYKEGKQQGLWKYWSFKEKKYVLENYENGIVIRK